MIIDHVGNYTRFGMPDDDREWTLDPKPKPKKLKKDVKEKIRQCPECFFTFPFAPVCPHCGYVFPGRNDLEERPEAKLTQIKGFTVDYRDEADCKSYAELLQYAETHGYKRGWAWYQAKRRGFIA